MARGKATFLAGEETVVTLIRRPGLARCVLFATLAAAVAVGGCTAQTGRRQTRELNASLDLAVFHERAPEIDGPLTLDDALDYAARYNIEVWIAAAERKFQHELATQSLLKMLPSLLAGAESSRRSEYDAASSVSLASRTESLEPSFSAEKQVDRWDISATWNLLDFGISFLRTRQQTNRELIAQERERRVRQNLALEVTRAYWRAVTARASAVEAARAGSQVFNMLEKIDQEIEEQTISRIEGLKRETALLEQLAELRQYKRSYLAAKAALAKLIGLSPGAKFLLAYVNLDQPTAMETFDVEQLERRSLRGRPELFEKDLEEAISRDEAHVALAQMFPSISAFWRYDTDYNRYLAFDEWNTAGIRVSWNLLAIPQQIKQRDAVMLQTELIKKRRTAIAVAILTQVHLALIDYQDAAERYRITETIAEKHRNLLAAIEDAAEEGKSHAGEALDHRLKYLKAHARHLTACANLKVAHARVLNALGRDPNSGNESAVDPDALSDHTPQEEPAGK